MVDDNDILGSHNRRLIEYVESRPNKVFNRVDSSFRVGVLLRLLGVIFLLMLLVAFTWRVNDSSNQLTFSSFLQFLSNLNSVEVTFNIDTFRITADWFAFNFLRDFFNIFANIIGILVWFFVNVYNVFQYFFQFVRFLIVG